MTNELPVSGKPRDAIPFAPEVWRFIAPTAFLLLTALGFGWPVVSSLLFVLLFFMLSLFKDPERDVPQGGDLFFCPADALVIRAGKINPGVSVCR